MTAYYNENDPFAAAWLRELIKDNLITSGEVDERSIKDVQPEDLKGFDQHHFFAGIGGWSYALRLAGWPDNKTVWTGSCPCQPFSVAGKRKGFADERHLWPEFRRLVSECQPTTVFGEQVASKDGRLWLSGVRADLEVLGYVVGAADLCAAGVGAPHIRQRLYWVAHTRHRQTRRPTNAREAPFRRPLSNSTRHHTAISWLGDAAHEGLQEQWGKYSPRGERCSGLFGFTMSLGVPEWNGPTIAAKSTDGTRRLSSQPNTFPLAHGVPNRVGILRGAGNAIVPQVAAEFIQAAMTGMRVVKAAAESQRRFY